MNRTILIVEDNHSDLELLLLVLSAAAPSVEIRVVRDGQEALDLLTSTTPEADGPRAHFSLVLLDIKMPRVDGFEVLSRLKANPATRPTPVIMFTSSDHETDVERAYQLGANGYVVKPVDFELYQNLIESVVGFWLNANCIIPRPGSPAASPEAAVVFNSPEFRPRGLEGGAKRPHVGPDTRVP